MKTQESGIQFLNVQFRESHIVFNRLGNYTIEINIQPKGTVVKAVSQFILQLRVNITDTENGLSINVVSDSVFAYPPEADLNELSNSLFVVNAPAIAFPYIRAYISGLTALSGMPTLTLPTLNLSQIGETLKGNIEIVE